MPYKPIKGVIKYGASVINGLEYKIAIYLGATEEVSDGSLGERVILHLVDKVKWESHHIYMDNLFTSPSLSLALRDCQTFLIGMACVTVKGFPECWQGMKSFFKNSSAQ